MQAAWLGARVAHSEWCQSRQSWATHTVCLRHRGNVHVTSGFSGLLNLLLNGVKKEEKWDDTISKMYTVWAVAPTPQGRNSLTLKSPLCYFWKIPGPLRAFTQVLVHLCWPQLSSCPAPSSLYDTANEVCLENTVSSMSRPPGSPSFKVYHNQGPGIRYHEKCTGHGFRNPSHLASGPNASPSENTGTLLSPVKKGLTFPVR